MIWLDTCIDLWGVCDTPGVRIGITRVFVFLGIRVSKLPPLLEIEGFQK